MDVLASIRQAVIDARIERAVSLTGDALTAGISPHDLIRKAYIPAMQEVGDRFQAGEFYLPEMLASARAMKEGLEVVRPLISDSEPAASAGKVVLGTVAGDLHDIGKNLVGMLLEGAGFQVIDLGTDVSPERFVGSVLDFGPDVVGLSALITTTMRSMPVTLEAFGKAGIRDRVKVIVGGAPVDAEFAGEIGADGYAADAAAAVKLVKELVHPRDWPGMVVR